MACGPSMFCGGSGSNGGSGGTGCNNGFGGDKVAKIYQDSIVGNNGANRDFTFKLCNWSMSYQQNSQSSAYLPSGTLNQTFNQGQNVSFVALEVIFDCKAQPSEDLYLKLSIEGENQVHCLAGLQIQQATSLCPVPNIRLSNTTGYDAKINILSLTSSLGLMNLTNETTFTNTFDDLVYKSIRTHDMDTISLYTLNPGGNPNNISDVSDMTIVAYIGIDNILNIERQGRFIILDDSGLGKIYLGFVDEYTAKQILSELNYLLNNRHLHAKDCVGGFYLPLSYDSTPPVIYNTSIVVSNTATLFLDGYTAGYITYNDLIIALVSSVVDDRDGQILINTNNLSVTLIQLQNNVLCPPQNIPNVISNLGIYSVQINVQDIAGNITIQTITLTVTLSDDVQGPTLVFNTNYIDNNVDPPYTIIYLDDYII